MCTDRDILTPPQFLTDTRVLIQSEQERGHGFMDDYLGEWLVR